MRARTGPYISDSNHNRISVATLYREVIQIISSGEVDFGDGDFSSARFDHPQGLALDWNSLYVADTENYAFRRVDLAGAPCRR